METVSPTSGSARNRHTPGPWAWGAHPSEDIAQVYAPEQPETSRTIADVYEIADARLIAAAPALLAACEALQSALGIVRLHEGCDCEICDALKQSRAAIASARGET